MKTLKCTRSLVELLELVERHLQLEELMLKVMQYVLALTQSQYGCVSAGEAFELRRLPAALFDT